MSVCSNSFTDAMKKTKRIADEILEGMELVVSGVFLSSVQSRSLKIEMDFLDEKAGIIGSLFSVENE